MGCFKADEVDIPSPDFQSAADTQAQSSERIARETTQANRPNIVSQEGSQNWTRDENGNWTLTSSLSPERQAALDAQMGIQQGRSTLASSLMGRVQGDLGTGMDWGALPESGGSIQARDLATGLDFSGAPSLSSGEETRNRAEEAIYGRSTARLDPQMEEQENELRTRLYNQGLREGDAAFDAEVGKFNQSKQDAYAAARQDAIAAGGAEASREYGMDLSSRQQSVGETTSQADFMNRAAAQGLSQDQAVSAYQNQLRQEAIAEEAQRRGMNLNEMNALLSGQQVGQMQTPSFLSATGADPTQSLAAANMSYQAMLDEYNANAGRRSTAAQALDPAGLFQF
jgi:hypothetical protein